MFCYNDAWLVNESLAFYMSTSTFSNPIFDAQFEQENSSQPNKELKHHTSKGSRTIKNKVDNVAGGSFANKHSSSSSSRWAALCDGLVFSVKSKIYVLEVNFKKELRRFKKFTSDHLPCFMLPNGFRNPISGAEKSYSSRNGSSFIKDKFWKEVEELSSREALKKQQEKVLYRLEKVLQAIRSEQQQSHEEEKGAEQQQYHFMNEDDELFNMSEARSNDGLIMQFARHPIVSQKPIMMSTGLTRSSSSSFNPRSSGQSNQKLEMNDHGYKRTVRMATKRRARRISKECALATKRHIKDASNNENSYKKLCIVCYTNSPNIVTLPCKHHDICSDCFIEIIYMAVKRGQYPLRCVLCRQKIEKIKCSRELLLSVIEKNRIRP